MPPFARIIASSPLGEIVSLGDAGAAFAGPGLLASPAPLLSVVPSTDDGAVLRVIVSGRKASRRSLSDERNTP